MCNDRALELSTLAFGMQQRYSAHTNHIFPTVVAVQTERPRLGAVLVKVKDLECGTYRTQVADVRLYFHLQGAQSNNLHDRDA